MINCPCRINQFNDGMQSKLLKCLTCNEFQHKDCIKDLGKMKNYECPSCQFKNMDPFYDVKQNILSPTLLANTKKSVSSTVSPNFVIASSTKNMILEYIKESEHINSCQTPLFIFIRCLKLDEQGYEHHWPLNGSITLNGSKIKEMKLSKLPLRAKPRQDYPYVIYFNENDKLQNVNLLNEEHFIYYKKLSLESINSFQLFNNYSMNDNDVFNYVVSIDLIRIRTLQEAVNSIQSIDNVTDLQSLLKIRSDKEIQCIGQDLNFYDIYHNKKIAKPTRSINCIHMNVFELEVYLSLQVKNKKFNCPICKQKAVKLYVDKLAENVISQNPDLANVTLDENYKIMTRTNKVSDNDASSINSNMINSNIEKSVDQATVFSNQNIISKPEVVLLDDSEEEMIINEITNQNNKKNNDKKLFAKIQTTQILVQPSKAPVIKNVVQETVIKTGENIKPASKIFDTFKDTIITNNNEPNIANNITNNKTITNVNKNISNPLYSSFFKGVNNKKLSDNDTIQKVNSSINEIYNSLNEKTELGELYYKLVTNQ